MLNLTPGSSSDNHERGSPSTASSGLDMHKTPLKHLSVLQAELQRVGDANTVEELYARLLDDNLAMSDPFQAAMGLVFMSRTGLSWDD